MWMAVGLISLFIGLAALVAIVIGLVIGIARKRWKVLKWSEVSCGVCLCIAHRCDSYGHKLRRVAKVQACQKPSHNRLLLPFRLSRTSKADAGTIAYEELSRNNEQYESQDFYFEGEIVQVIERRGDEYDFRVRVGKINGR